MEPPETDPPEIAIARMIRGNRRRRGLSSQSRFTRVTSFPPVGEVAPSVRAALDGIEPLLFGSTRVWAVAAETTAGSYERTMLELWAPLPQAPGRPGDGLSPRIEPTWVVSIVPSPHAPPTWVSDAAWRLPVVHDITQVRFTTGDGATWIDAWSAFPVYFTTPEGISWSDVVDVALHNVDGQLRSAERGMLMPRIMAPPVHCPFDVPGDDPLLTTSRAGPSRGGAAMPEH